MEKAKRILFTVAGILSIVGAVLWVIFGIIFVACASNADMLNDMFNIDEDVEYIQAMFATVGVVFIICAIFACVNAVVSFKGKNSNEKGMMIVNIIFGAISGIEINILAAIFGLIVRNRKQETKEVE